MARKAQKRYETMDKPYAERLRELIDRDGITQSTLAAALGIQRQTVSNYANGQSSPDAETVVKIADYFHVTSDSLLGRISDEGEARNAAQAAVNWTGLSEKSIGRLHQLQQLGFDMSTLDSLLEELAFYRTVLDDVKMVSHYAKFIQEQTKSGEEYEIPADEQAAINLLSDRGYSIDSHTGAAQKWANSAGAALTEFLSDMVYTPESIRKLHDTEDKVFIMELKTKAKEDS